MGKGKKARARRDVQTPAEPRVNAEGPVVADDAQNFEPERTDADHTPLHSQTPLATTEDTQATPVPKHTQKLPAYDDVQAPAAHEEKRTPTPRETADLQLLHGSHIPPKPAAREDHTAHQSSSSSSQSTSSAGSMPRKTPEPSCRSASLSVESAPVSVALSNDEDEPVLNYDILHGSVADILAKDTISRIAVSGARLVRTGSIRD